MPKLRRVSDGEGFSGSLVESIAWNEDGTFKEVTGSKPKLGESLKVGSPFAGTYSNRDWWMTTPITKILEERWTENGLLEYMKFKTENSTYEMFG